MIKPFLFISALLLLLLTATVVHYVSSKPTQEALFSIVQLTHRATPALSVGFDNPQSLHGAKHNLVYPEMPSTSPLEFVYVQ